MSNLKKLEFEKINVGYGFEFLDGVKFLTGTKDEVPSDDNFMKSTSKKSWKVIESPKAIKNLKIIESPREIKRPKTVKNPETKENPKVLETPKTKENPKVLETPKTKENPINLISNNQKKNKGHEHCKFYLCQKCKLKHYQHKLCK